MVERIIICFAASAMFRSSYSEEYLPEEGRGSNSSPQKVRCEQYEEANTCTAHRYM